MQAGMRWLEAAYPENARGWVGFNVPMSHKVRRCTESYITWGRTLPVAG